jgi:hypothetical protein
MFEADNAAMPTATSHAIAWSTLLCMQLPLRGISATCLQVRSGGEIVFCKSTAFASTFFARIRLLLLLLRALGSCFFNAARSLCLVKF